MYGKILAKQLWPSTVPFQTTWVEQMMMIKKAHKKIRSCNLTNMTSIKDLVTDTSKHIDKIQEKTKRGCRLTGLKSSLRIPLLGEAFFTSAINPGSPVRRFASLRAPIKSLGGGAFSSSFFNAKRGLLSLN